MIHFPKPKFSKPQARRATRSKASKLQADAKRRAFLAAAKAEAQREANAAAAVKGFRAALPEQKPAEVELDARGVAGMDSTIGAPL